MSFIEKTMNATINTQIQPLKTSDIFKQVSSSGAVIVGVNQTKAVQQAHQCEVLAGVLFVGLAHLLHHDLHLLDRLRASHLRL